MRYLQENVYVANEKGFGYSADVTRHILEYVSDPKTLLNVSQVNKLIRKTISLEMVITVCMRSGGRSLQSINNLQSKISCRAFRVPSALRLLRVCNMKRCEFCGNAETPDIKRHNRETLTTRKHNKNPRPRVIREAWGCTFPCYTCLTKNRDTSISKNWSHPCLNRYWHRVLPPHEKTSNRSPDMEYEPNREIYDRVFSHSQAASYRYGDQANNGRNGWEILWSFPMQDASGEYISPLITFEDIDPLVRYLKTPGNLGISHYLKHNIPDPSSEEDYQRFENAVGYNMIHGLRGFMTQQKKKRKLAQERSDRRLEKIGKAVKAIGLIVRFVNVSHLAPLRQSDFIYQSTFERVVGDVQRLLLCYMEVHQTYRKHCLEYNTGNGRVNKDLMDLLGPVILKPEHLTRSEARTYATRVFKLWVRDTTAIFVDNVFRRDSDGRRTRFSAESIRRRTGQGPPQARRWRDTRGKRIYISGEN